MTAVIQLTFDGGLVREQHHVTMRDLAQTMLGLQAAADRACLDVYTGNVWKHQKLPRSQYPIVEFIVGNPQEGSYVIDFFADLAGNVVERIRRAIAEPYAEATSDGNQEIYKIGHQIAARKDAAAPGSELITYQNLANEKNPLVTRTYGDRLIKRFRKC
jgi:hypothetical protein